MPSEDAEPLSEIGLRSGELPAAVGSALDCTNVPDVVNSSINKGADVPDKAVEPSPARQTTIFPAVNAAARSVDGIIVSSMATDKMANADNLRSGFRQFIFMFKIGFVFPPSFQELTFFNLPARTKYSTTSVLQDGYNQVPVLFQHFPLQ